MQNNKIHTLPPQYWQGKKKSKSSMIDLSNSGSRLYFRQYLHMFFLYNNFAPMHFLHGHAKIVRCCVYVSFSSITYNYNCGKSCRDLGSILKCFYVIEGGPISFLCTTILQRTYTSPRLTVGLFRISLWMRSITSMLSQLITSCGA